LYDNVAVIDVNLICMPMTLWVTVNNASDYWTEGPIANGKQPWDWKVGPQSG